MCSVRGDEFDHGSRRLSGVPWRVGHGIDVQPGDGTIAWRESRVVPPIPVFVFQSIRGVHAHELGPILVDKLLGNTVLAQIVSEIRQLSGRVL